MKICKQQDEMQNYMIIGNKGRTTGATKMNEEVLGN